MEAGKEQCEKKERNTEGHREGNKGRDKGSLCLKDHVTRLLFSDTEKLIFWRYHI